MVPAFLVVKLLEKYKAWQARRRACQKARSAEARGEYPGTVKHPTGIDWETARAELGVPDGEKLYAGYDERTKLGWRTRVFIDGRPLERSLVLSNGIVTHEENLDVLPEGFAWVAEELASRANTYDRSNPDEVAELALALLADARGDFFARRHYEDIARLVIDRLPVADTTDWDAEEDTQLALMARVFEGDKVHPPDLKRNRHAPWFLRERELLSGRSVPST